MSVPDEIRALLGQRCRVAVVGASDHPHKYGCIITRDLLRRGFTVLPVNPRHARVAGLPCAPTLADAGPVDIADFVVPPEVSLEVVNALAFGGDGPVLWFQPGSFDARVVNAARRLTPRVVAGPCIMVEAR